MSISKELPADSQPNLSISNFFLIQAILLSPLKVTNSGINPVNTSWNINIWTWESDYDSDKLMAPILV